ncbi:putative spermidine/putrescine transport system ATP-binding protein [Nicoletella semolina]|uniref:Putative spermidine/putrescine transport system ATP-binding protein n=1 Tax=Nicoletella semolina TaxID=271160 RepID=A0A4R2N6U4_9PAST|nr:ABC transporter ATP-binding protein [Nicoletella semolina]MDH2924739.1 spermidine/putrescine ABC transporter ATP-binding protein [Nicoletella semolina]TCP16637.1 putative spermidine/putrescine transport system ATP-binding protein [Nicoletella semolina]
MSYLNVLNLTKKYTENTIFENICFYASKGEFVTLLGPSGCGKSTLLRCIAGLTEIDSGQILLNEKEITYSSPQKRNIAMVFQSYALFPNMTVYENVAFGLKMRKVNAKEIKSRVSNILELVELEKYRDRYPQQLSGGQSQRVALARSLVIQPDLLLLDEPLSALDARIRKHLRQQIRHIQQELNLTTIFVTHDQEEALMMSDRIVLMNQGKIEQACDAETLYLAPRNRFSASFIGNYNILNRTDASKLLGRNIQTDIAIRPESISLQNDMEQGEGVIIERNLLGNIIRYKVRVNEVDLVVDKLNLSREHFFPLGTLVRIHIEEEQIRNLE